MEEEEKDLESLHEGSDVALRQAAHHLVHGHLLLCSLLLLVRNQLRGGAVLHRHNP
jgi:hypothetical protein